MLNIIRKAWRRNRSLLPQAGYFFDRPLVVMESDDWGRVGVRDREGFEFLWAHGVLLGERPYDLYTLETAGDLARMREVFSRHRDSAGGKPCLVMNFLTSNVDFPAVGATAGADIPVKPLHQGLPGRWQRPGLLEAYADGIHEGLFWPALHGSTHFCQRVASALLGEDSPRGELLRCFWAAETPYIHWRMPWIGYEYWNPEPTPEQGFLSSQSQEQCIQGAAKAFRTLFGRDPLSACAPGYRSNHDTVAAWSGCGVQVAQHGSGTPLPPHFDPAGVLNLSRMIDFEPAVQSDFSLAACLRQADECFRRGVPAVISIHSINFHSTLQDFCATTLKHLDAFLSALESRYPTLLYVHDAEIAQLVKEGKCEHGGQTVHATVTQRWFTTWDAPGGSLA